MEKNTRTAIDILKNMTEQVFGTGEAVREEWVPVMYTPRGETEEKPLEVDGKEVKFLVKKLDGSNNKDRITLASIGGFIGQFNSEKFKSFSEIKADTEARNKELADLASKMIVDWSFAPEVKYDQKAAAQYLAELPGVAMQVLVKASDLGNGTNAA